MAEYFVDTPKDEIITPKHLWESLAVEELCNIKIKLSNRTMQYRNTSADRVLKSAISEIDSLIAQKKTSKY